MNISIYHHSTLLCSNLPADPNSLLTISDHDMEVLWKYHNDSWGHYGLCKRHFPCLFNPHSSRGRLLKNPSRCHSHVRTGYRREKRAKHKEDMKSRYPAEMRDRLFCATHDFLSITVADRLQSSIDQEPPSQPLFTA